MPLVAWNERMSVGVEALDGDHRKLISLLNRLYDGIKSGCGRDEVGTLLEELRAYTKIHFAREERLLAEIGYIDQAEHRHEHANMVDWITELQVRWSEARAAGPRLEMVTYLKDWLFDHILGSDQRYAEYMKTVGVR